MQTEMRFEIGDLLPIAMTLVVAGIGIAYGLNVMGDLRDDMICQTSGYGWSDTYKICCSANGATCTTNDTSYSYAGNSTIDAIVGVSKIPAKLPLIVTVVVAAIIIGILVRYLWGSFRQ